MILDEILEKLKQENESNCYTINNKTYTYKDFYKFVCNIYNYLQTKNTEKRPVIVYGHKDVYMKATFLACSFAGMTYVPIDINMPKERVDTIIEQVNPIFIIGNFENDKFKNISQDEINKIMEKEDYEEITQIYMKPTDIYYIIFTSGSTGTPKGVKVTYSNLDSCINWLKRITKIEDGIILNQASFSFDLSVADLYLSLITQSEHYILEKNVQSDFKLLFDNLEKSNGTMMVATPSFADLLMLDKSFNENLMPKLKTILFCGEKLLPTTVQKLYSRFPNLNIINSYGPTECTFAVTSIEMTKEIGLQENIPIGKPKKDVEIFIVDENKNQLPDGNLGEIIISGASVADGYIGDIKKEAFIIYNKKKAYLTGDLGYIKDGNLYCIGRKDKQIKYKGYRIELQDIEKNIYELSYIDKAVVVAKAKDNKVNKIIAFVKLKEDINKTTLEIKTELQKKIPDYMCPTIKIIDEFPLNQNGKCDEKKLLEEY